MQITRSLLGVQALGLIFSHFNEVIKSTMPTEDGDKRMVLIDNEGTEIEDSSFDNISTESIRTCKAFNMQKMVPT